MAAPTEQQVEDLEKQKNLNNSHQHKDLVMQPEQTTIEARKAPTRMFKKDTGWAWMVVLGGFMVNYLVVGTAVKSFGVVWGELKEKYDTTSGTPGVTIVAVTQSLCLMLGPFVNILAMMITIRRSVFIGGVIMFIGYMISAVVPSINYLYFSYGVLVGIGGAMAYSPSIVMVGQYFEKRRALATGLAVAGSGVGTFVNPPIVRFLVDYYGSPARALIILGVLTLNICVAALLLRPVPPGAIQHHQHGPEKPKNKKQDEGNGETKPKDEIIFSDLEKNEHSDATNGDKKSPLVSGNTPDNNPVKEKGHDNVRNVRARLQPVLERVRKVFDVDLLHNSVFWLYAISIMLMFSGYPILYVMLPDHARNLDLTRDEAGYLVSILGVFDLLGRVFFGFIADLNLVSKRYLFGGCTSLAGLSISLVPLIGGFYLLATLASFMGSFAGGFFALVPVLLSEKLGVARLHSSYGMVVMFMGASVLFSAPVSGVLKNQTGSWNASFILTGVVMLIGSLLLLLEPLAVRREKRNNAVTEA